MQPPHVQLQLCPPGRTNVTEETLRGLYKPVADRLSGNNCVARYWDRWRAGTVVCGRACGTPRRCGETNDRSARKSLMYGAGRTVRRAMTLTTGGAYSHLGCRFDCPRGYRGKPHRRAATPGRGASAGRRKAAAALARVVQAGPGPAARGWHVSAGARMRSAPYPGRGCPLPGRPRPVSFCPSHASHRHVHGKTEAVYRFGTIPSRPLLRAPRAAAPAGAPPPGGSRRRDPAFRRTDPSNQIPLWQEVSAMALHICHKRKFLISHSGAAATRYCNAHRVCLHGNASNHAGFRHCRMWKTHIFN